MFNISSYLEKFKSIGMQDALLKEKTTTLIQERFGITINKKDITYKNGIMTLKVPPILKTEIFMKKQEFLKLLSSPANILHDIR